MELILSDRKTENGQTPTPKLKLICGCGCGTTFFRYRNKVKAFPAYFSRAHQGAHTTRLYLEEMCGPYLDLIVAYLDGPAKDRYRDTRKVRTSLAPFFSYLNHQGITELAEVSPATIGSFVVWAGEKYRAATRDLSALSTFFHWCRIEDLYPHENPVIPSKHVPARKQSHRGRPYSDEEIDGMRERLDLYGTPKARAIFELALETGLRNGEICRLRIGDVNLASRTVTVGLPNKTMQIRESFFYSDRVLQCVQEWLVVRRADCDHDFLFHNEYGGPLRADSLLEDLRRSLQDPHPDVMDESASWYPFEAHRLRHTCASRLKRGGAEVNTLMTQCGWRARGSIETYTAADEQTKMVEFAVASLVPAEAVSYSEDLSDDEALALLASP